MKALLRRGRRAAAAQARGAAGWRERVCCSCTRVNVTLASLAYNVTLSSCARICVCSRVCAGGAGLALTRTAMWHMQLRMPRIYYTSTLQIATQPNPPPAAPNASRDTYIHTTRTRGLHLILVSEAIHQTQQHLLVLDMGGGTCVVAAVVKQRAHGEAVDASESVTCDV